MSSDLNSLNNARHPISTNRTPPEPEPVRLVEEERDSSSGAGSVLLRVVGFIVAIVIVVAIKVGVRAMFR